MLISTKGPVLKSNQLTTAMTTRLPAATFQRGARRSAVFSLAISTAAPPGGWTGGERKRPAAARSWGEDKRPGTGSAREERLPPPPPPCNLLPAGRVYISDSVNQMRPMPAHLGEFEQLVRLALLRLGEGGCGVTVRAMLEQRAHRRVSLGTVYKTLLRLEAKGLVAAWVGEPTPERGGRRKKHYRVTGAGRRDLSRSLEALRKLGRGPRRALDPAWQVR